MDTQRVGIWAVLAVLAAGVPLVNAQWSSDAGQNLLVANGAGSQDQPKIAVTRDGGCYISWFDFAAGGIVARIQRFNANGVPQFGANGVLVLSTTLSSSNDYGIIVDGNDDAVLACQINPGGVTHAGLNKIKKDGSLPWGPNGVQASIVGGVNFPRLALASDGDYVVGWSETGDYLLQRFDPNGVPRWAAPYRESHGSSGSFTLADIQDGTSNTIIAQFVHQTGNINSPKYLKAQKYAADASKLWNGGSPVVIMDGASLGIAYFPGFMPDGQGGAVIGWYDGSSGQRRARAQHLDANGLELFPHNGAIAAAPAGIIAVGASVAYNGQTRDVYLGFIQTDGSTQSQYGLYAQRFDPTGTVLWGADGLTLVSPIAQQCAYPRTAWLNGALEFYFVPSTAVSGSPINGYRLSTAGAQLWPTVPLAVSSYMSVKSNKLTLAATRSGMAILAWGDNRNDSSDVYAQNVNPSGTLGLPVFLHGDTNCDGAVTFDDINPFVLALSDPGAYHTQYPTCDILSADVNGDGVVDFLDINPFVAILSGE